MRLLSNAHLFNLSVFCEFVQDWTEDFWMAPRKVFSPEKLLLSPQNPVTATQETFLIHR
jgi:hypothetical protein